jgi:hypothetical protein
VNNADLKTTNLSKRHMDDGKLTFDKFADLLVC